MPAAPCRFAYLRDVAFEHALPGARGEHVQVVVGCARECDDAIEQGTRARNVVLLNRVVPEIEEQPGGAPGVERGDAIGFVTASLEPLSDLATGERGVRADVDQVGAKQRIGGQGECLVEERSRVVRAACVVGGATRFVQALSTALRVRRQSRGALEQPCLCVGAAATAGPRRDPRELRRDLLVVSDGSERAMPGCAIRIEVESASASAA